jgi:glycosyltransferase involved in cell wall biosynthesis
VRKFALVSPILPPDWSGQSLMLYRLLSDLPADQYCLLTKHTYSEHVTGSGYTESLTAPHYQLIHGPKHGLARAFNLSRLLIWSVQIAAIARRERCEAIVACSAGLFEIPSAYLASRILNIPFYAYLFDDYVYQRQHLKSWKFAEWIAGWVLPGATNVIVPNEFLCEDVARRFGIKPVVIHNPCDLAAYEQSHVFAPSAHGVRIVYTGSVYDAHYDAFRNLLNGIRLLDRDDVKLHLYTANTKEELSVQGIEGPVVFYPHQAPEDIPGIQCSADILFLGLAFKSNYPNVLRTAAPGKLGEYLAAHRPILAHAPADSFLAWYCQHYDCGMVVDQPTPQAMADSLKTLLNDKARQERMITNAWARARADFSIEAARSRFTALLS